MSTNGEAGSQPNGARVAIYWDFENVHASVLEERQGAGAYRASRYKIQEPIVEIDPVVEYALTFGPVSLNRAYANWQWFGKYSGRLQDHAVDLVQLFPLSGTKNGADIRLAIDVIEDLHQHPHITHVLVVGGDSDYVGLAQRCRKLGRTVLGVGVGTSNSRLIAAFDQFRYYHSLVASDAEAAATAASLGEGKELEDARDLLIRAIRRLAQGRGDPWVKKAALRPMLQRLDPSFTEESYGFTSFDQLLQALSDSVGQRVGVHDHEFVVLADIKKPPEMSSPPPVVDNTTEIERRLRKTGTRLPSNVEMFWAASDVLVELFTSRQDEAYDTMPALTQGVLTELQRRFPEVVDSDATKVRNLAHRGRVFLLLGEGNGIRLKTTEPAELRWLIVRSVVAHVPDIDPDDLEPLIAALCGDHPDQERVELVRSAFNEVLNETRDS